MASDPLVLAFDTAAAHCAAALVRGERLLAARDEAMDRGQAERLLPMLEEILAEAGLAWSDLDALAVGVGPGNFTGVRIGVAAARGLAMGLAIPAVGISLFERLAPAAGPALVLARDPRGDLFAQPFADGAALAPPARAETFARQALPPDTLCVGAEATVVAAELGLAADPAAVPVGMAGLARLAIARLPRAAPPVALYLRPADARPMSEPPIVILDDA